MASNGGCGGCGGAYRQEEGEEFMIQQGEGPQAQRMQQVSAIFSDLVLQLMQQDEDTAMAVNALNVEEAADLLRQMATPTHNLRFGEDGDLESDDGEDDDGEANEDEDEEDEGEAAGGPVNVENKNKQTTANAKIVRTKAHGVQTLAVQEEIRKIVQSGLTEENNEIVVALAAAMVMASRRLDDEPLQLPKFVEAVQAALVTEEQVKEYCAAAGVAVDAELNGLAVKSVRSLATMFRALEKLGKVTAQDPIEGNAMGMCRFYEVVDKQFWDQLLQMMCGVGRVKACTLSVNVFPAVSTLYEALNILGYGADIRNVHDRNGKGQYEKYTGSRKKLTGLEKKLSALSHKTFYLNDAKRQNNVGRLTSKRVSTGQNKAKQGFPRGEYQKCPDTMVSKVVQRQRSLKRQRMHEAKDVDTDTDVEMTTKRKRVRTTAQKERHSEVERRRRQLAKEKVPCAAVADEFGNVVRPHCVRRVARIVRSPTQKIERSPTPEMSQDKRRPAQHQQAQALAAMLVGLMQAPVGGQAGVPPPPPPK